jgi:hypothetical protein
VRLAAVRAKVRRRVQLAVSDQDDRLAPKWENAAEPQWATGTSPRRPACNARISLEPHMLNRRTFICVASAVVGPGRVASETAPGQIARIGFLGYSARSASSSQFEAFLIGLREPGWIEGKTAVIEYRSVEGQTERLATLVTDLVRSKVDQQHETEGELEQASLADCRYSKEAGLSGLDFVAMAHGIGVTDAMRVERPDGLRDALESACARPHRPCSRSSLPDRTSPGDKPP